jgi:hypothetical protein
LGGRRCGVALFGKEIELMANHGAAKLFEEKLILGYKIK